MLVLGGRAITVTNGGDLGMIREITLTCDTQSVLRMI